MSGPAPLRSNFRSPSSRDSEAAKLMAYRDHGYVVIAIDDHRLNWEDREELKRLAVKIYGPRKV